MTIRWQYQRKNKDGNFNKNNHHSDSHDKDMYDSNTDKNNVNNSKHSDDNNTEHKPRTSNIQHSLKIFFVLYFYVIYLTK